MYHLPPISGCLRWMFSLGGGRGGSRKNLREEDFGMLKKREVTLATLGMREHKTRSLQG